MRISTTVGLELDGPQTIDQIVDEVRHAAQLGLAGAWWAQLFNWDALTALTVAGRAVPDLPLGTAVVTTYPRHPLALASQALSVQAAIGNRLTLGIGPSHKRFVEPMLGFSFERPALHTREYLTALGPLLRGESVDFDGEIHHVAGQIAVAGAAPPRVLLAALGPVMLRIAGELTDGTVTTWTGVRTIADHIVPTITAAADAGGQPAPEVVTSLPVAVTDDAPAARAWVGERFGLANDTPSYRAMLDREGLDTVDQLVIAGDEDAVEEQLRRFADVGATELIAVPFGDPAQVARTLDLLGALATSSALSTAGASRTS
ncbi:MAG TPA: TIGR03564 family F420-dependent LLM class oxidoreductase [Iamia sp.]|nr:TIGR03564 family F420-dependent LLM class oxidoreductase [Iamia sp.]